MRLPPALLRELAQALNRPQVATALAGAGGGAVAGGAYGIADEGAPGGPLGSAALGAGIGAAGLPYLLRNRMDDVARSMREAGSSPREPLDGLSAVDLRHVLGLADTTPRPPLPPRGPNGRWPDLRGNLIERISNERARRSVYTDEGVPTVEQIIEKPARTDWGMGETRRHGRDTYLLAGGTGDARAVRSMLGLRGSNTGQAVNTGRAVQTEDLTRTLVDAIPADPTDTKAINLMRDRWRAAGIELTSGEAQLVVMQRAGNFSTDRMSIISNYSAPSVTLHRIRAKVGEAGFDGEALLPRRAKGSPAQLPGRLIAYLQRVARSSKTPSYPSSKQIAAAIGSTENAVNMALTMIRSGGESKSLQRHGVRETYSIHTDALAELEQKFGRRVHGGTRLYGSGASAGFAKGEQKRLIEEMMDRRMNALEIEAALNAIRAERGLAKVSRNTVFTAMSARRSELRKAGQPAPESKTPINGGARNGAGRRRRRSTSDALLALLGLSAAGGGLANVNSEDVRRAILGRLEERI